MTQEYNHLQIEKKWQDYWELNKTFKVDKPGHNKFYCLDMFPYPSGSGLHVGHPLGYTATDIYSRYMRMLGYSVLHPMGFDAFGLPAEQHAISTGEHPESITHKNCEIYSKQLKRVGLSYDWDRNLATCDPEYYKWTQWIFLKIYNSWFDQSNQKARPITELPIPAHIQTLGNKAVADYQAQFRLAYYAEAMVNWCPALGTVLANEEVIDGKSERGGHDVIRKPMKQWMMRITKYAERLLSELDEIDWPDSIKEQQKNWIGRKTGCEINFQIEGQNKFIPAFTTRADTLFGVTFFVVSPEHVIVDEITTKEQKSSVQDYCAQAKKMSDLARSMENRKKTGVFSGTYVINPINKERVPIYVGDYVLMNYGTGAVMGVPAHDQRDFEFAKTFDIAIRPVIIPKNAEREVIEDIKANKYAYTEPGIMLASEYPVAKELKIDGIANSEAAERISVWLEKNGTGKKVVNYKLRDWLFSRQRYWGEPFPIIHWEDGSIQALDESELPLLLPKVENYKPSDSGESPLAKAADWVNVVDAKTGRKGRRETNTMPNWAGSCWYYLRFIDPKNTKQGWTLDLERSWMPVDLYVGGAEHAVLHLLYARFWHKILFDLGYASTKEPFQKLFNQGMVQGFAFKDKRGALVPVDEVEEQSDGTAVHKKNGEIVERIIAKISKSLRNVISLDDTVETYGADTFRMYLMFMGPLDSSRPWDPKAIVGNQRFLKRVWTWVQEYAQGNKKFADADSDKVKRAVNLVSKRVGNDIKAFGFNTAISAMMEFINEVYAEEISKPSLEKFVLLLSPFAPHIAEELWQSLGHKKSLAYEAWPSYDEALLKTEKTTVVIQIGGKKRATLEVDIGISESELKAQVINLMASTNYKVSEHDQFFTVFQAGNKIPRLVNVVIRQ